MAENDDDWPRHAFRERLAPSDDSPGNLQDSWVIAFSPLVRRLAVLAVIVGVVSIADFAMTQAAGQPFKSLRKWQVASILALPVGLGIWAMASQVVRVMPDRIVSRHLFSGAKSIEKHVDF